MAQLTTRGHLFFLDGLVYFVPDSGPRFGITDSQKWYTDIRTKPQAAEKSFPNLARRYGKG